MSSMQTFHKTWPAAGVDFYTTSDEYRAVCKFTDYIIINVDRLGNYYKNVHINHIITKMYNCVYIKKKYIIKTYSLP